MIVRSKLDRNTMGQRLEGTGQTPPKVGVTEQTKELIEFVVYMRRVGADTHEWPVSVIIPRSDEDKYREYHQSVEWHDWADRNRVYRNVRIEVKSYKEKS